MLVCCIQQDLEAVFNRRAQIKVVIDEAERVVLQLRQIQQVIDEVLHHPLREYLILQRLGAPLDSLIDSFLCLGVKRLMGVQTAGHCLIQLDNVLACLKQSI